MSAPTNPKFDDRTQELWDLLSKIDLEDLAAGADRLSKLTRALSTAAHFGYVDNAEMVPTPETSLADARMVSRLVDLTAEEVQRVLADLNGIRCRVDELLTLAEVAQ